jgi:hypothetical protein
LKDIEGSQMKSWIATGPKRAKSEAIPQREEDL